MTETGNTFEHTEPSGSNPMPEGSEIGSQESGTDAPQPAGAQESASQTSAQAQPASDPQSAQPAAAAEQEGAPSGTEAAAPSTDAPGSDAPAATNADAPAASESAGQPAGGEAQADAASGDASADATGDASGDASGDAGAETGGEGEQRGRRGSRGSKLPQLSEPEMREIWSELAAKKESNESIDLEVISRNRGGVVTHYRGVEVFIPMSHWTLLRQPEEAQGESKGQETVTANVLEMTDFDTDARRVTATRRPILRKSLLDSLEVGQRIHGRVSSILDFGVFVDLGGIDGLLHTTEISYTRGRHPSQLLTKGEEVDVIIREIDREKERIYLGRKELLPSPWEEVEGKYPVNTVQQGKVVGLGKMGAFVELEPGIEGFIRASELSWTKRIHNPKEVLKKGQEIPVKVLDVSGRKKRLSLSFRQAQENPWETLAQKYAVGTNWEGEIKEISNKGLVVGLEDVEGFLPRGRMGREAKRLPDMKAGDKISVSVIEVDPQRLSLIFGLPMPERGEGGEGGGRGERGERGERRGGRDRDDRRGPMPSAQPVNEMKSSDTVGSFSIGDMIGQSIKEKLFPNMVTEEKPKQQQAQPAAARQESAPAAPTAGDADATIASAGASGTPPLADQGDRPQDQEVSTPDTSGSGAAEGESGEPVGTSDENPSTDEGSTNA